jgi:hypothetical protein
MAFEKVQDLVAAEFRYLSQTDDIRWQQAAGGLANRWAVLRRWKDNDGQRRRWLVR